MLYYDYAQVPHAVAEAAFAEFRQSQADKSIFDLLDYLISHCDAWCKQHNALSEQDNRVAVLKELQAYLHEQYADEMRQLMQANISKYQQRQGRPDWLYDRRN